MGNEQSVACAPGQSRGRAMGEEVIYSLWIGFCFFCVWILFCFESYLSHALPSQGSTQSSRWIIEDCVLPQQHQREAHVGGGGACWCGAGGPGGYNLNCNVGSCSDFRLAASQGHKGRSREGTNCCLGAALPTHTQVIAWATTGEEPSHCEKEHC